MSNFPFPSAGHIVPVLCLVTVMVLSRVIISRQMRRRGSVDRDRLRASLAVELAAVRDLLDNNLDLLAAQAGYVVSGRGSFLLLRASAGRLAVLERDELAVVLAAYGANERLEAVLAVAGRPSGPSAFRVPPRDLSRADIHQAMLRTRDAIETALRALEAPPAPARRRLSLAILPRIPARDRDPVPQAG